jgi:hypothetical protein
MHRRRQQVYKMKHISVCVRSFKAAMHTERDITIEYRCLMDKERNVSLQCPSQQNKFVTTVIFHDKSIILQFLSAQAPITGAVYTEVTILLTIRLTRAIKLIICLYISHFNSNLYKCNDKMSEKTVPMADSS